MQAFGHQRQRRLLQTQRRKTRKRRSDEEDGQVLYGTSHGRRENDASAPSRRGPASQPEAGPQADEKDGDRCHLPNQVVEQGGEGVLHQAIPTSQPGGHAPQPGLVDRHNLCPDGTWSHVPGGHHRRVQPPHPVVEAGQHLGRIGVC